MIDASKMSHEWTNDGGGQGHLHVAGTGDLHHPMIMIEKGREEIVGHLLPGKPKGEAEEPTKEETKVVVGRTLAMSMKRHL